MLKSFRLGNHRSFRDEHELLLMPALPGDDRTAVPVAAIYGANASGKSNLLDGLAFMVSAVRYSFSRWGSESAPRRPFRLDPAARERPSVFVAEFVAGDVPYTYGFTLDDTEVREEWLYSFPEKRKRIVFERTGAAIRFGSTVADTKAKLDVLEELIRPNVLLLSVCASLKLDQLMPAYDWFRAVPELLPSQAASMPSSSLAQRLAHFVEGPQDRSDLLMPLLSAADVGITGIDVIKTTDPKNGRRYYDVRFRHGADYERFELNDESAGTRSWLELLLVLLPVLDTGSLALVDELDRSLHPLLTAKLIGLFKDPETNPHGAQLIFTTHDTSLLGTMLGDQVLDRDQIWFVEKQADGASTLYPLTDFKPRKEQNTERRYLAGSYGAVPVLDRQDFVDAVLGR
ncbi:hypothetical protein EWH70_32300 [Amycolatopsis suaedae]|uniref:ATPase AAA-type core domain-containing protein n=1 Tax=Amycolatopsis suaedae TaxID=2510978 RepID=A0A4Q7J037_9PSEU|nr:hypothetical protein EWH70_32300 [Amycolatopsis suaedae]